MAGAGSSPSRSSTRCANAFLKGDLAIPKPSDAELARDIAEAVETTPSVEAAKEPEEEPAAAAPAGAEVTNPENLPSLDQQPPPRPGSIIASIKEAADKAFDIGRDIQMLTTPMAVGSREAMATLKDFANRLRRNRWEWSRIDEDVAKRFTTEQRERMWDAADEESVLRQEGRTSEHMGLATLDPPERAAVEDLQARAQNAFLRARDLGMVEGEGLPSYTPRMLINVAEASSGERSGALALLWQFRLARFGEEPLTVGGIAWAEAVRRDRGWLA
jgi:hypothetical protein